MNNRWKYALAFGLAGAAIAGRLLPHPWNFTPLAGALLASGAYLGLRYGLLTAFVSFAVSDYLLGTYDWRLMAVVYAMGLLAVAVGTRMRRGNRLARLLLTVFGASTAFFLTTNFAVWYFSSWYPPNAAGLIECYTLALPFFRNSLAGDLFYTTLFCLAFEMLEAGYPKLIARSSCEAKTRQATA
jgi:uncharacterized membrane protein